MKGLGNLFKAIGILAVCVFVYAKAQDQFGTRLGGSSVASGVVDEVIEPLRRSADVTLWQAGNNGGIAGFFTQLGVGDPVCDPASMSEGQLRRAERRGGAPRRCPREYDDKVEAYFQGLGR